MRDDYIEADAKVLKIARRAQKDHKAAETMRTIKIFRALQKKQDEE